MTRKKIGEILVEKGLITNEQLLECLEDQRLTRDYLGAILLRKRLVSEETLLGVLSEQFGIPFVSLKSVYIDWQVCLSFAPLITEEQKVMPIRGDDTTVTVAVSDPLDVISISKIEELANPKKLKLVLVTPAELKECAQECKKKIRDSRKNLLND